MAAVDDEVVYLINGFPERASKTQFLNDQYELVAKSQAHTRTLDSKNIFSNLRFYKYRAINFSRFAIHKK